MVGGGELDRRCKSNIKVNSKQIYFVAAEVIRVALDRHFRIWLQSMEFLAL
jgi:hypothetical protein